MSATTARIALAADAGSEPPTRRGVATLTTGHVSVGMRSRFLGPWAFLQGMGMFTGYS